MGSGGRWRSGNCNRKSNHRCEDGVRVVCLRASCVAGGICQWIFVSWSIGRGNGREVILTSLPGRRACWICWVESFGVTSLYKKEWVREFISSIRYSHLHSYFSLHCEWWMKGFARLLMDVWCFHRHQNPKHNTKYTLVCHHHVFTHVLNG